MSHRNIALGGIQQLRGQDWGEGGQPKVHACPRGQKPSYFRKYFILLCNLMGGKKGTEESW